MPWTSLTHCCIEVIPISCLFLEKRTNQWVENGVKEMERQRPNDNPTHIKRKKCHNPGEGRICKSSWSLTPLLVGDGTWVGVLLLQVITQNIKMMRFMCLCIYIYSSPCTSGEMHAGASYLHMTHISQPQLKQLIAGEKKTKIMKR